MIDILNMTERLKVTWSRGSKA